MSTPDLLKEYVLDKTLQRHPGTAQITTFSFMWDMDIMFVSVENDTGYLVGDYDLPEEDLLMIENFLRKYLTN